jgi:hypothetical protein
MILDRSGYTLLGVAVFRDGEHVASVARLVRGKYATSVDMWGKRASENRIALQRLADLARRGTVPVPIIIDAAEGAMRTHRVCRALHEIGIESDPTQSQGREALAIPLPDDIDVAADLTAVLEACGMRVARNATHLLGIMPQIRPDAFERAASAPRARSLGGEA